MVWSEQVVGAARALRAQGSSYRVIAQQLSEMFPNEGWHRQGPTPAGVKKCLDREDSGAEERERKHKFTKSKVGRLIFELKKQNVPGNARTLTELAEACGVECHKSTVCRAAQGIEGYKAVRAAHMPLLSPTHIKKRLKAAPKMRKLAEEGYFDDVVFADEKVFCLGGAVSPTKIPALYLTHPPQAPAAHSTVKVQVWAAIGPDGLVGPHRIGGSMNSEAYCAILEHYKEEIKTKYYDDHARCHTSLATSKWLKDNDIIAVREAQEIPSKLIELNIIEPLWAVMEREVWKGNKSFATLDQLWQRIQSVCQGWKETGKDKEMFSSFLARVPPSMKAVKRAGGKWVGFK